MDCFCLTIFVTSCDHPHSICILHIDNIFHDDDEDDTSSMHSGKYSFINYCSGSEHETEPHPSFPNKNHKATRFSPDDCNIPNPSSLSANVQRQCSMIPCQSFTQTCKGKRPVDNRQLLRNRSFVDLRSQLLHRTLVEELSRQHFKTVGAVENIGFQMPCGDPLRKGSLSSSSGRRDCKVQRWGRS